MRRSIRVRATGSSTRTSILAFGLLIATSSSHAELAATCRDTARQPPPPRAAAMAAAALREHIAFGRQTMDAEGRLVEAGAAEAEDERRGGRGTAPWQRVIVYWRAIDPDDARPPYVVRFGALRAADRALLQQALNQASTEFLQGLGVGPDQGLGAADLRAVRNAVDRAAVIDTPWSAAFVSWLAREAGLHDGEFLFSEAHADYAGAAWQAGAAEARGQPTTYAMRACDVRQTPPRVGDLVCQARGADASLDTFDKIGAALGTRSPGGPGLPMHCDVVTAVDARGFETVGGNVLDSVTRRRLDFARGTQLLDPSYLPEGCSASAEPCIDRHMSRQPWSLLLQWR